MATAAQQAAMYFARKRHRQNAGITSPQSGVPPYGVADPGPSIDPGPLDPPAPEPTNPPTDPPTYPL